METGYESCNNRRNVMKPVSFSEGQAEALSYIETQRVKDGMQVKFINSFIGKGLFTTKAYAKGEFLVEYEGELISQEEGKRRLKSHPPQCGSFIFFFSCKRKKFCIDATFAKGCGRYANDAGPRDVLQNAHMRMVYSNANNRPYLALFANRNILGGEEIRYDYNDQGLPWRKETLVQALKIKNCSVILTRLEEQTDRQNKGEDAQSSAEKVEEDTSRIGEDVQSSAENLEEDSTSIGEDGQSSAEKMEEDTTSIGEDAQILAEKVEEDTTSMGEDAQSSAENVEEETTSIGEDGQSSAEKMEEDTTSIGEDSQSSAEKVEEDTISIGEDSQSSAEKVKKDTTSIDNSDLHKRPCPFCGTCQTKLKRHLILKHSDEEEVSSALLLPKRLQSRQFAKLRKQGIFKANAEKLKTDDDVESLELIRERRQGTGPLTICSFCQGVYKRDVFYKHKRVCFEAQSTLDVPTALKLKHLRSEPKYSKTYQTSILDKFFGDKVGQVIQRDACIKDFGQQEFQVIESCMDKKDEKRQTLMSNMRKLARLFIEVERIASNENIAIESCEKMFDRNNINFINEAIKNITTTDDSKIKPGLKIGLRYVIQKVNSMLILQNLIRKNDAAAEELQKFKTVLELSWPALFSGAQESVMKRRQTELRKPQELPSRIVIEKIRDYTEKNIDKFSNDEYDMMTYCDFCNLRDALVTRLTLFNARRGGEPSRMKIRELQDALDGKWIDPSVVEKIIDDMDKVLLHKLKIGYIHSSKSNKVVPIIIPVDCLKGLRKLIDVETRKLAGIHPENDYVFPNTQSSKYHVVGWQCVNKTCIKAGVLEHINATQMRHYVATEYALLDVDEKDRDTFYKHMGHSKTTNENIYQCPPALKELVHVGKFFMQLDKKGDTSEPVHQAASMIYDKSSENYEEPGDTSEIVHQAASVICEESPENYEEPVASTSYSGVCQESTDLISLKVKDFLEKFVEELVMYRALSGRQGIDEDEVEIVPETLAPFKALLLDENVQREAKKYFTDDGWLAVEGSLNVLKTITIKDNISSAVMMKGNQLEKYDIRNQHSLQIDNRSEKDHYKRKQRKRKLTSDISSQIVKQRKNEYSITSDQKPMKIAERNPNSDMQSAEDGVRNIYKSIKPEKHIRGSEQSYTEPHSVHQDKHQCQYIARHSNTEYEEDDKVKDPDYQEDERKSDCHDSDNAASSVQRKMKIERAYYSWSKEDSEKVLFYFETYTKDTTNEGTKGKLPGTEEIKTFSIKYPEVLHSFSQEDKIFKIRAKVFGERQKTRRHFFKKLKLLQQ